VLLTIFFVLYSIQLVEEKSKTDFSVICDEISIKITTTLHSNAELLRSGSALFASSDTVTREKWKAFYEYSKIEKNLPNFQAIGFSLIILKKDLQKHIHEIGSEGITNYTVFPAGERDIYTSTIFIEPFIGRNLRAFGYDMFSDSTRRKAMEIARDSDVASLSGKVKLLQDKKPDSQAGAIMYVPVYRSGLLINNVEQRRNAIKGWIYSLSHGQINEWSFRKMGY
jgi:CHASE1-domain containing sensor protein